MVSRGIVSPTAAITRRGEQEQPAIFGRNSRRRLSRSGVHAASPGQIAHDRNSRLGYFRYLRAQAEERNECSTHGVDFN